MFGSEAQCPSSEIDFFSWDPNRSFAQAKLSASYQVACTWHWDLENLLSSLFMLRYETDLLLFIIQHKIWINKYHCRHIYVIRCLLHVSLQCLQVVIWNVTYLKNVHVRHSLFLFCTAYKMSLQSALIENSAKFQQFSQIDIHAGVAPASWCRLAFVRPSCHAIFDCQDCEGYACPRLCAMRLEPNHNCLVRLRPYREALISVFIGMIILW